MLALLGTAVVGGLVISQVLTLYLTPVVYTQPEPQPVSSRWRYNRWR